jgi:uncharacterized RDD family membrane protein YckC
MAKTIGDHMWERVVERAPQGLRAGFVSRLAADLLDVVVVSLVAVGAFVVAAMIGSLTGPGGFRVPRLHLLGSTIAGSVLFFVYLATFWGITGRTPGKQVVGLRVIESSGKKLRPGRAALRAAFYVVFPIGLVWALVSRRNSSLQDLLLRTAVIYDYRRRVS